MTCDARWYTIQDSEKFLSEDQIKYVNRYRGKDPKMLISEKIFILNNKNYYDEEKAKNP